MQISFVYSIAERISHLTLYFLPLSKPTALLSETGLKEACGNDRQFFSLPLSKQIALMPNHLKQACRNGSFSPMLLKRSGRCQPDPCRWAVQ